MVVRPIFHYTQHNSQQKLLDFAKGDVFAYAYDHCQIDPEMYLIFPTLLLILSQPSQMEQSLKKICYISHINTYSILDSNTTKPVCSTSATFEKS